MPSMGYMGGNGNINGGKKRFCLTSDLIRHANSDILDETGHVKVLPFLRVEAHGNIFAAGDVTSIKEIKQGFLAGKQAQILAQNIKSLIKNPNSKLKEYTPLAKPMGIVSLGRQVAVAELPMFGAILGWLPWEIEVQRSLRGKCEKRTRA